MKMKMDLDQWRGSLMEIDLVLVMVHSLVLLMVLGTAMMMDSRMEWLMG